MTADAVLASTEAGAGHCGGGGLTDQAAGPLQMAGRSCISTDQGGGELAGVVWQVDVYGCSSDDACRIWDAHIYKNNASDRHA